ncbi:NAD synthetase [Salmonella enterica subsp. enterica]|nr:NAD synthetase [Salmonella enterica subsp. enterica]
MAMAVPTLTRFIALTNARANSFSQRWAVLSICIKKSPPPIWKTTALPLPDEAALGVTYDNIDDYLEGKTLDPAIAKTIEGWYVKTEHKRRLPITVFDDFWKK